MRRYAATFLRFDRALFSFKFLLNSEAYRELNHSLRKEIYGWVIKTNVIVNPAE